MKIFILHTRLAETAPKFTTQLKNCEAGNRLPQTEERLFVINYGTHYPEAHLNKNIISNKFEALRQLKEVGVNVPAFTPLIGIDRRNLLHVSRRWNVWPLLARKLKHFKGKDIIFLKSFFSLRKRVYRVLKRHMLVQYVPKEEEFRVHVLGNTAPIISKKVPSERCASHHPHVWTTDRGWTLIDYNGEHLEALKTLGIQTLQTLKYDFGAVDIGLGRNGKFYVFEINSAPRLSKTRRLIYAKFFRQKEKEWRNQQERR